MFPHQRVSNFFVNSRPINISHLLPKIWKQSAMDASILWGASKITAIPAFDLIFCKKVNRLFFFDGKKLQKDIGFFWSNLNPHRDIAVVSALGPGTGIIEKLLFLNSFIKVIPGSDMQGVPASQTNPTI